MRQAGQRQVQDQSAQAPGQRGCQRGAETASVCADQRIPFTRQLASAQMFQPLDLTPGQFTVPVSRTFGTAWLLYALSVLGFLNSHHPGLSSVLAQGLGISTRIDFATFPWLGNTGSVALPITMAIGLECGHVRRDENIALLGIGSGINSLMLAVNWQRSIVAGSGHYQRPHLAAEPQVAVIL